MQPVRAAEHSKRRFVALDGLRGVATLMVVAYHIGIFLKFPSGMTVHGNIAVDFFLCLSGFVLAFAHERRLREGGGEFARFLMSRVVRLWPSVLAGSVAALLVALGMAGGPGASSAYRAFALSLIVLPRLEGQNLVWFNGVYWSLFAEILVNLLWAVSVKALGNRGLITIAFVLSVAITWVAIDHNSVHFFYQSVDMIVPTTVRALASFCMGVVAYRIYEARRVKADVAPVILIAALLFPMIVPGVSWFGIPLSLFYILCANPMIVLLGALGQREQSRVLTWLGNVSFPLYATHLPVVMLLSRLMAGQPLAERLIAAVGIVGAALIVAEIVRRFVEKPALAFLGARLLLPRRAVSVG